MKQQTESEITHAIRSLLKTLGVWHFKHWSGPLTGLRGVSDILGIWNGRFLAIEIKNASGKVSDDQQKFIDRVCNEGGIGFVARSVDDVIRGLGVEDRFLFATKHTEKPKVERSQKDQYTTIPGKKSIDKTR